MSESRPPGSSASSDSTAASPRVGAASPPTHFADDLIERVRALGHPLCIGLDPHLKLIAPLFRRGAMRPGDPQTAEAVGDFLCTVIDRIAGRVAIVKPQIAFFEQLGWRGMQSLERVCAHARAAGLLVLLDAKRGDIGSTAEGYANAYLAGDAPLPVDAMTINPYLGFDTIAPFASQAQATGRGIFVLVKTSNAGSGDLQDRDVEGETLFGRVADGLSGTANAMVGSKTGWSSLGVVCGATWPDQARRVRESLPNALFLVPGYGAQGGSAAAAIHGFRPGPSGLEGGIVNSSRGILFPASAASADSATTWEPALESALDQSITELAEAITA